MDGEMPGRMSRCCRRPRGLASDFDASAEDRVLASDASILTHGANSMFEVSGPRLELYALAGEISQIRRGATQ
jgi:hypothetical protein